MSTNSPRPAVISEASTAVLAVEGATKRFGAIEVLRNVSLAIGRHEIRAICGENGAGKSTLVKLLTGVHALDAGALYLDGKPRLLRHPQEAQELGIALVAQELSLAPDLSVEDNIWLGNRNVPLLHRRRALHDRARRALDQVGLGDLALDLPVAGLSIGQRQLVELARMLTREARILILDEPTATLSDVEIARIFAALRALRDEGKSIIYITHRLGEVFELCDTVSVLRNGELVGTRSTQQISRQDLIEMMLGRSMGEMYPHSPAIPGTPALAARHLHVPGTVEDFSFTAERGKVVCLAGQIGSGATEILRALAGLATDATGEVMVAGSKLRLRSVARAQREKIQFVSEDRAQEGVFLALSVARNLVATRLREVSRLGILNRAALWAIAARLAAAVGVDRARLKSPARELSGGNQQKLAFGRAIGRADPGLLLMNEPTRGVDVGARAEIYRLIRELSAGGYCLVMASSDLEEVLGMGDVIITLYRGRQVGIYRRAQASLPQILADITHPSAAA